MKILRSSGIILNVAKDSIIKINAFLNNSDFMIVGLNLAIQSLTSSSEIFFSGNRTFLEKVLEASGN